MQTAMDRRHMLVLALAGLSQPLPASAQRDETADLSAGLAAGDGELVYVGRDPVRVEVSPAREAPRARTAAERAALHTRYAIRYRG